MPDMPHQTTHFLNMLTAEVAGMREIVNRRFRPLSDDQLNRGPGPGKWSVGQCLEHLNIVGGLYLPLISRKLKAARERGTRPAELVKHGYFGRKMTEAMRVPAADKPLISPQQYAPSGYRLPRTVLEVFGRQLDELTHLIEQARTVNMNAVRIPNPIIPLYYPRLPDVLEMLVVHLDRHINQAERVLDGLEASSE